MKEKNQNKEQNRKKAIELYNNNWKVSEICSTLNCSRNWFYKWLKRYQSGSPHWYKEQSRAPKTVRKSTDNKLGQQIIQTRKELLSKPYMQYGPQAIYYNLKMKNIEPPPVWTIARILKRNNLTNREDSKGYVIKGKKYPYDYLLVQQMDFVGPRYLYSKLRFYFHNIICAETHFAQISVLKNQTSINVCNSLIKFWKSFGQPDYLQMDNDLSFWGSLNKPTAVGKVIRVCLLLGITPVFIPVKEPWRNGIIEHFNNKMQQAILNSGKFENIDSIQKAADNFCKVHNKYHRYSSQDGMTPEEAVEHLRFQMMPLDENFTLPTGHIQLSEGEIHVIRFIRSNLKFSVFGLTFNLPEETMYEYVLGIIITHQHRLLIFKDKEFITEFKFILYD